MIWIIIAALVIVIDRISKYIIESNVEYGQMISVIDNIFYITHHQNKGAAWGILQNGRIFFIILTPIIAVAIIYFIFKPESKFLKLALSFVLGGAAGNYIDRVLKGEVTDFLQVFIGTYPFPIFNIADSSIVLGTILLAIYLLFMHKEQKEKDIKN